MFKLALLGNSGVGKTCFQIQFTQGLFRADHLATVGVEFATKRICIGHDQVRLQIWDTAGQENFRSITRSFYRRAHGILLMFDITNRQSFKDLPKWLAMIQANGSEHVAIIVVGNMLDLAYNRAVSEEEGIQFVVNNSLGGYMEASAKNNQNVTEVQTI